MSSEVPAICPAMRRPTHPHFLVINMDRSVDRLRVVIDMFVRLGLPFFERVPGVEIIAGGTYDVPRIPNEIHVDGTYHESKTLKDGDYGCALAHRRAWQAVAAGAHDWAVILEDDALVLEARHVLDFPLVPQECDIILLRPHTVFLSEPICTCVSCLLFDDDAITRNADKRPSSGRTMPMGWSGT